MSTVAAAQPFDLARVTDEVNRHREWVNRLFEEVGTVVVGQRYVVERLVIGLLAGGHVLLEGVPGLAKTLAVSALADALSVPFQRIQFTPDLLPADLVGTLVYNPQQGSYFVRKGPVFTNLLLADEINRAPAKVQSALLEAMQERQVTIGETTYKLSEPFLVLATQNPVEQEGTYPLPEAQVDRFMLKIKVGYPTREEELTILRRMARTTGTPQAKPVAGPQEVLAARSLLSGLYMDERVEAYIVDLVVASRQPARYRVQGMQGLVAFGASPRATIALALASRAHAFLQHRAYVTPDDVRAVAHDVLRHRLTLTFEAEAEGVSSNDLVQRLLDAVEVP
ncbi:MAG: MoxR family ATPase [Bacteroidetes bacterium]|nr:MoxR family ATPase [Bacteroidota bacterium]